MNGHIILNSCCKNGKQSKGVALVTALIVTLVVFLLIMSTIYFTLMSTSMSGAGKRYASASEAADGAVEVVKDTINLTWWGDPVADVFPAGNCEGQTYNLSFAIQNALNPCTTTINLPAMGGSYKATITVEYLYNIDLPGGRLEFARAAGGVATKAIYYRITTIVEGPNNTTAETSALYRFTG